MSGRKRIKHRPAPDRSLWRVRAKNEAITEHAHDLGLSSELNKTILSGFDLTAFSQHADPSQDLGRADVDPHALSRTQRPRRAFQQFNQNIDGQSWLQAPSLRQDHAALNRRDIYATQIDRPAL